MLTQVTLDELLEIRDASIDEVEQNASVEWKEAALSVVRALCRERAKFTADDVWERLQGSQATTHEPRALGAIFRFAKNEGWIENTMQHICSSRKECHARPIPVWRSLLK